MRHEDFIYNLALIKKPKAYLELGLYQGNCINKISNHIKDKTNVIGVDLYQEPSINGTFYKMSTDSFFEKNNKFFDMIFIDADHSYESVKKDFFNSIKFLNRGGIIILHDTDPENDKLFDKGFCGDAYKFVKDLEKLPQYNIITLPVMEAGLSLVTKIDETRVNLRNG